MNKKLFVLSLFQIFFFQFAVAQNIPTNDLSYLYRKQVQALQYSYDENTQTHNYSSNWDLDGDGTKDEIYFIGTGGAHLYNHLKVVLSSNRKSIEFEQLETDFPQLIHLRNQVVFDEIITGFSVIQENEISTPILAIKLDESTFKSNHNWLRRKGVNSGLISICFEKGKIRFSDWK